MKRKSVLLFIVTLCIIITFSSCSKGGKSAQERAEELQELYLTVSDFIIDIEMTANYGEYIYTCGINYEGTSDFGNAEITSPDEIKGLQITIADGGSSIVFDGAELYMGKLADNSISPMSSIPAMLQCWQEGYITQCAYESIDNYDTIAVETSLSGDSFLMTWFDLESNHPVRAEITYDGTTIITCTFNNFKLIQN